MNKPKIGLLLSARMGSSRLPGKSMMPLKGIPLISYIIRRLKDNKTNIPIYLMTTTKSQDDELEALAKNENIPCFRGSEDNLIERCLGAAKEYNLDYIVRATGDCPFINDEILDYCVDKIKFDKPKTLFSTKGNFPVGLDLEFFKTSDLEEINFRSDLNKDHKEHLTLYFYQSDDYQIEPIPFWLNEFRKDIEYTLDEKVDYDLALKISEEFSSINFPVDKLIEYTRAQL